jgi:TPR repeat protein
MKAFFVAFSLLTTGTILTATAAATLDLKTIQAQAAHGNAMAEYQLGRAYQLGQGVPRDYAKAAAFYRQAAAQGNAKSMFNLGYIYLHGQGVPRDAATAHQWFQKSADQGLAAGELQIGLSYYFGDNGLKQDYVAAAQWLQQAAEQENFPQESGPAANALGAIYEHGFGVPMDRPKAFFWYHKGADLGNARAQANLGRVYEEGALTQKDPLQAYVWLKIASDQQDTMATHLLPEYLAAKEFTAEQKTKGDQMAQDYEEKHRQVKGSLGAAKPVPILDPTVPALTTPASSSSSSTNSPPTH